MAVQKLVVVIADNAGLRHERVELSFSDAQQANANTGLLIGRGWHCDLIVQDPLVDAEHARLFLDSAGMLQVEDLGSLNGIQRAGDNVEQGELLVGTSTLEFHRVEEPVAPTLKPSGWGAMRNRLGNPLWPLLALLLVVCMQVYFDDARELRGDSFVVSVVGWLLACGAWALFWGVLSKLLRNGMQMAAHLSVISWGLLTGWLITEVAQYLGWQAQSPAVVEFVDVFAGALWAFAIGAVTLGIATRLHSRLLLLMAAIPGLLLVLFTYGLPLLQGEERQWGAPVVNESYPPGWHWGESDSMASFLDGTGELYDLSAERAAERAAELDSSASQKKVHGARLR